MKRILTLFLSALLVFSALCSQVSANPLGYNEVINYETNEWITNDEMKILHQLGVSSWVDISEMGARNSETITRWFVAWYLNRLVDIDLSAPEGFETLFRDMTSEHKYYIYVKGAVKAGYMRGDADGYFRPDSPVTADEAATVLLRVLGYEPYIEIHGKMKALKKTNIFDGIPYDSQTLTQAQFLKMIFNALNSPALQQSSFEKYQGGEYDVNYVIDETYLGFEHLFGVKHEIAVLDGIPGTNLIQSSDSVKDGHIKIAGVDYKYEGNAVELLGYSVNYVFREQGDERTILHLFKSDRNEELVLTHNEIDGFSGGVYEYADGNKTKKIELSSDARVILNDVATPGYSDEEMVPDFGSVTFVDNDGKKGYEVVKVVDYDFYYSSSILENPKRICDTTGEETRILELEDCDFLEIRNGENIISFDRLKKGNLLVVKRSSRNSGYDRTVIETFKTSKKGMRIVGKKEDSVSSENASYGAWGKLVPEIEIGKTYDLFMFDDTVVFALEDVSNGTEYGILVGVGIDDAAFSNKIDFAFFDFEGNYVKCEGAEKIILDGTRYSDYDLLKNKLSERARLSNGYSEEHPVSQPVKLSFNSNGKVNAIDTFFYDSELEEETSLQRAEEAKGTTNYFSSHSNSLYNLVEGTTNQYKVLVATASSATSVLFVPKDRFEEDSYVAKSMGNGDIYCVDILGRDEESWVADAVIVYYNPETSGVGSWTRQFIVSDLYSELVDDEIIYTVEGFYQAGKKTYYCNEELFAELSVGDVYRFETDRNQKIITALKVYDINDSFPDEGARQTFATSTSTASGTGTVFGSLVAVEGDIVRVAQSLPTDIDGFDPMKNVDNYLITASTGVYKYSVVQGMPRVEEVSISSAVPYFMDAENPSVVILNCLNGLNQVYIIEK